MKTVSHHQMVDLIKTDCDEILLQTSPKIELHIIKQTEKTIIKFPFGNKFDIVDGCIIIHER
jgi:hypothetical protein